MCCLMLVYGLFYGNGEGAPESQGPVAGDSRAGRSWAEGVKAKGM